LHINLTGKVALVTGGGRGIGRVIAATMARAGAVVILNDINIQSATDASQEIAKLGRRSAPFEADVSRKADVDRVVREAADSFGRIDILVNNAGVVVRKPAEDYTEEDWDRVIDTNLKGTFNFSQAVGRLMIQKGEGGRIISISSVMGLVALAPRASYVSSKGGIVALTRDLAAEWARHRITVNAICPGWVTTEMTEKYFSQPDVNKFLLDRIPLGRFAEPSDVANMALFLASDLAGYVTGQSIPVDGGWTIQ
jgi:NAD(P)-dependent dehydrogenase (short-subunit alcohol dehydrogenase family)